MEPASRSLREKRGHWRSKEAGLGGPGAKHGHMSCFSHVNKIRKLTKNKCPSQFFVLFCFFSLGTLPSFGNLKKNKVYQTTCS